jgi:hypothetical protein
MKNPSLTAVGLLPQVVGVRVWRLRRVRQDESPSLTREQHQQADAFFQALPKQLADLVPDNPPSNLKAAVLEALAVGRPQERTPQQLVDFRLLPKWNKHYASRDAAGPIERPVGVLIAMLRRDAECGDGRCDERTNVDTGAGVPVV